MAAQSAQIKITPVAALEAIALARAPDEPYLLIDLRDNPGEARFASLLQGLPCPVLALGTEGPLASACDVIAKTEAELAPAIANILHAPLAASILVQTLRRTEAMAPQDALFVESLAYATLQAGPEFARWKAERKPPEAPPVENGPPLILERESEKLLITLNRPRNRNAISIEMRDALVEAFALPSLDDSIAKITVRGAGACFSVGGDLAEFGATPSPAAAHMIRMQRLPARAILPVAQRTEFVLHGACIGAGIELPAFAARISASANTFFQLPEIHFGLIPGAGGCVSIPRRIGRQRMAWLTLSARRIPARTALSWGLIDEITK